MAFSLLQRKILNSSARICEKNIIAGAPVGIFNLLSESIEVKKVHTLTLTAASRANHQQSQNIFSSILPSIVSTTTTSKHTKKIPSVCNGNFCLINKQQSRFLNSRDYSLSKKSSKEKLEREYESESDSDCDEAYEKNHPKGKERGDSEFWRRKMRTLHDILDINHDGVLSFDDLMLLTRKFTDLGHLSPKTSTEFLDAMTKTWEDQWGEITPYNTITAEQFLADMHHALNDKDLVKKIGRFLPYIFKAVDTDHSGYLDLNQFKLFFNCLGLTDEDAAVSFAVIDKNGDGKLTLKEFCKLGKEFFLTEDERRVSRMFWGPLVNH